MFLRRYIVLRVKKAKQPIYNHHKQVKILRKISKQNRKRLSADTLNRFSYDIFLKMIGKSKAEIEVI